MIFVTIFSPAAHFPAGGTRTRDRRDETLQHLETIGQKNAGPPIQPTGRPNEMLK
ncbi:MAG: hypothetical protein JSR21_15595 [Proteobacteria bacterium]|nr:hypothetical protein [Pseudomonadota bacterium]